jgi:GAF domain-containing protein
MADPVARAVGAFALLARIVMNEQSLGQVLHQVADLARTTVPGADEVSVTLIERGRPTSVAFTGDLAVVLDERQYRNGFGPCVDAARRGQVITIEDTAHCPAYPDFATLARRKGVCRTLSVNVPTRQGITAALNIYGSGVTGPFDRAAVDLAVSFAGYAAIALLNAALYAAAVTEADQLRQAMVSRAGIEQAKGIVMRDRRCTAEEAFIVLRDLSSTTNHKVRDIAQSVIDDARHRSPDG